MNSAPRFKRDHCEFIAVYDKSISTEQNEGTKRDVDDGQDAYCGFDDTLVSFMLFKVGQNAVEEYTCPVDKE